MDGKFWVVSSLVAMDVKCEFKELLIPLGSIISTPSTVSFSIFEGLFLAGKTFFITFQKALGSPVQSSN